MATRKGSQKRRGRSANGGAILLAVAVVIAAFVSRFGGNSTTVQASAPVVVAEFDTISIPVPVEPIAAGTRLRDVRFKTVAYPRHQLPAGAIEKMDPYLESSAILALPANLPLFPQNVALSPQIANPVVEQIPQGMRAMTVRVDATSAVEGWAGSGSVVDVLLVEKNRTTVVAERVKILSAERSVSPVEGSAAPSIPTTVTILVTQEQCLAINTAVPLGRLAFALRSRADQAAWSDTIYTAERLKGGSVLVDPKGAITGYASVAADKKRKAFALSNGKWIATESMPTGLMTGESIIE